LNSVENNYLSVLRYIQEMGQADQAQIAKALGLSLMTVNKIINRLLKRHLVVKAGKSDKKSGRRSNLFRFNPHLYYSIGIDISEDRLVMSAVDPWGNEKGIKEYNFKKYNEQKSLDYQVMHNLSTSFYRFIDEFGIDHKKIAVVGVAPAGIIDTKNGILILGTHLAGVDNLNLRSKLQEIIGISVFVDDPARAIAYYEKKYGQASEVNNFIYVYLGRGVGSGIVINNEIYRGFGGTSGEIGHIIVDSSGFRCKCGNFGCLETVASTGSIIRRIKEGIREGVFTKIMDVCQGNLEAVDLGVLKSAAENNDKFSHNILEHIGNQVGKAICMLLNILSPQLVLIGGEVSVLGPYLLEPIKRVIRNETMNVINEKIDIAVSNYDKGRDSVSIAIEAFDMLFSGTGINSPQFINNILKTIFYY